MDTINPRDVSDQLSSKFNGREMTFGEKLVGLNFNPSNDDKVSRAKKLCAELADLLMDNTLPGSEGLEYYYNKSTLDHYLKATLRDHALHSILDAQMNVVKVLTLK